MRVQLTLFLLLHAYSGAHAGTFIESGYYYKGSGRCLKYEVSDSSLYLIVAKKMFFGCSRIRRKCFSKYLIPSPILEGSTFGRQKQFEFQWNVAFMDIPVFRSFDKDWAMGRDSPAWNTHSMNRLLNSLTETAGYEKGSIAIHTLRRGFDNRVQRECDPRIA